MKKSLVFVARAVLSGLLVLVPVYLAVLVLLKGMKSVAALVRPFALLLPDWFPIPAYAVTNPIFIDTKGDGQYDAPLPPPDFCSRECQDANDCASGQVCLAGTEPKVCGFNIPDDCDFRIPWPLSH